jgi:RraA family protein
MLKATVSLSAIVRTARNKTLSLDTDGLSVAALFLMVIFKQQEFGMVVPGSRRNPAAEVAPQHITDALQHIVVPHLSDNMARLHGVVGLERLNSTGKLVGTALTVKCRPGDNLMIYAALLQLRAGHVLVIDGGGDCHNALVGELIQSYAAKHGCQGIVVDGAVRDVACFENFPCYARGVSHRGPYKDGPGELNVPVSIGGQVVNPGDLVVGDEDGLVTFPQDAAEDLIILAGNHREKEIRIQAEIDTGSREQSWLNNFLAAKSIAL